jgi:hypothetical protein
MSTPPLGREAVVMLDSTEVGYAENVKESIDASLIKKYKLGSDKPAVLKSGNKTFQIEFGAMYLDKTYAEKVLNGAAVTVEVRPNGTGTGKEKHTYTGVILNKWGFEATQDGVAGENVSGEGADVAFGTQT